MPPKRKAKVVAPVQTSEVELLDNVITNENVEIKNEYEPVVLQLPISAKRLDSLIQEDEMQTVLKYNPIMNEPQPYIPHDSFSCENDILENFNNLNDDSVLQPITECETDDNIIDNVKNNTKTHHDIVCYWCCHKIINIEYGMPIRYDVFYNNFTMFGSFCSLECASAYNFSIHMGCDRAWEIHSWIQLLAQKYGLETPIRPAPNKYLLEMFNGSMTIEEFRNSHKGFSRTYVMNIPPFIHINSQIECLNTSFMDLKNKEVLKLGNKRKIAKIEQPEQKLIFPIE